MASLGQIVQKEPAVQHGEFFAHTLRQSKVYLSWLAVAKSRNNSS